MSRDRSGGEPRVTPPGPADRRGRGPGPRSLARARPGEGTARRGRASRDLRDVVRDRDPRPVHVGRRRGPRRGSRPRPPRRVPVHPRRPADDVPQPVLDDAPVRRVRDGRGDQPALPLPPRAGPDRAVGRLRPADPDGLRLRRARGGGGGGPGRRPDRQPGRHGGPARRPAARQGQHVDDDQRHGARSCWRCTSPPPRPRACPASRSRAPPRTTSSRSTSPAAPTSSRRGRRCASSPTSSSSARPSSRNGTRFLFLATTCARPGRPPPRSWRSRWPMRSPTSMPPSRAAWTSTTSPAACRSSSPPGPSCSRRSPSSGSRAGCGRRSCASGLGPPTRVRGSAGSTSRPRGRA